MTAPKPRRRARLGDVIEIDTARGRVYAQYTHKGVRFYGSLIRVLPGFFLKRPEPLSELVRSSERYLVFFEVGPAAWRGDVTIVGNEPIPERLQRFPLMRAGIPRTGQWSLFDGTNYRPIATLTEDHKRLSIAELWNYPMLITRLEGDWDPTHEV